MDEVKEVKTEPAKESFNFEVVLVAFILGGVIGGFIISGFAQYSPQYANLENQTTTCTRELNNTNIQAQRCIDIANQINTQAQSCVAMLNQYHTALCTSPGFTVPCNNTNITWVKR